MWAAETVIPSLGWWQVPHDRPLLPRLWKNGPVRSMEPFVLIVCAVPPGFGKWAPLGLHGWPCCPGTAITINTAPAVNTIPDALLK
jgi:hypothetical protein